MLAFCLKNNYLFITDIYKGKIIKIEPELDLAWVQFQSISNQRLILNNKKLSLSALSEKGINKEGQLFELIRYESKIGDHVSNSYIVK